MKKVILASVIAIALSGCAIQPAENVKALRLVNLAEANLVHAEAKKEKADKRADKATLNVAVAKIAVKVAKDKFEKVYAGEETLAE